MENQGLTPEGRNQVEALLKFVIEYEKALIEGRPEPKLPRFDKQGHVIDENEG
jgi:hypothetical protein